MVEKGAAGGGEFDAAHAAVQELNADLIFEIADLATEGRLRRVEPFLRRQRQAALLGDRDEIANVPYLHSRFHTFKAYPSTYKVFGADARRPYLPSSERAFGETRGLLSPSRRCDPCSAGRTQNCEDYKMSANLRRNWTI